LHPVAVSTTVNEKVSGTPTATPFALPKLDVMSRRTTPAWVSTSGPFDPSPGYGPAVSSGIVEQVVDAPKVVDVADAPLVVAVAAEPPPPVEQPAAATPRPPSTRSACRRENGRDERSGAGEVIPRLSALDVRPVQEEFKNGAR
jgi:hypothetical protein